jgi:PknH-like extracellular domain
MNHTKLDSRLASAWPTPLYQKDERTALMMHGLRRRIAVAGSAAAIALTLAACGTHTTAGVPVQAKKITTGKSSDVAPANPAPPPKPLPASSIKNLGLSTEDVDEIVGMQLDDRAELASPGVSSSDYDHPSCALAMGLTKEALGDGEFTAYRAISNRATKGDSLIGVFKQIVATFETAAKASELFHNAYGTLGKCNATTISATSESTVWKILAPGPFSGDVANFSSLQQTDKQQNLGWRCSHQVRVKNNVLIEALYCGWANGGPATAAAVDQISARIPPPDKPSPRAPSDFLAPDKIKSVILGVPQVGKILGFNLGVSEKNYYPVDPRDLGAHSNCSPLLGPDANSYGTNVDYTAFREVDSREDKDTYQHIVNQQVATYADTDTASRTFQSALKNLGGCDGARVPVGSNPDEQFQFQGPTINDNSAQWTLIDLIKGQPNTWRCVFNFRTQSNVVFSVKVCQFGNPSDIAGQIADQMANSIPK